MLTSTNYFDSRRATCGAFFLSWNAGAGRLLVPDNREPTVREMGTAEHVILNSGPWNAMGGFDALELLFEDNSDAPFAITMGANQSDHALPDSDQRSKLYIAVWTRGGMRLRLPARYRKVLEIPCFAGWRKHSSSPEPHQKSLPEKPARRKGSALLEPCVELHGKKCPAE